MNSCVAIISWWLHLREECAGIKVLLPTELKESGRHGCHDTKTLFHAIGAVMQPGARQL